MLVHVYNLLHYGAYEEIAVLGMLYGVLYVLFLDPCRKVEAMFVAKDISYSYFDSGFSLKIDRTSGSKTRESTS